MRCHFHHVALMTLLLMWSIGVKSQCEDGWVSHIRALPNGGLGNNQPRTLSDPTGNVYAYAVMVNTDSLNISGVGVSFPMTTKANNGFFCVKYSPDGAVQWVVPIGSVGICSPTGMVIDNLGNVYLSGNMRSQLYVHGQGSVAGPQQGIGYFFIKLNADGEFVWSKSADYGYSSVGSVYWHEDRLYFSIGFSDSLRFDSGTYHASQENIPGNFDHLYGFMDDDGNLLNAWVIGGAGSLDVRAIGCNTEGCIVQGRFDMELRFSETILTTPASLHYSLYQLFISHSGQVVWADNSVNGSGLVIHPYGLVVSADGASSVSSGLFEGSFTYGGHEVQPSTGRDVFIHKTDLTTGQVEWLSRTVGVGNDASESIGMADTNVMVAISFSSNEIQFDGQSFPNSQTDNSLDGLILSLDSEGRSRCNRLFSGSGDQSVRFIHGFDDRYFLSFINFSSPVAVGGNTYSPLGVNDALIVKSCLPCDTLTGITETTTAQPTLHIHPNPASQSVRVNVQSSKFEVQSLEVIDMLGNRVLNLKL